MPLYDFRCRSCAAAFEARVPAGETAPCPECGSPDAERVYGPVATYRGPAPRGAAAKRSNAERSAREYQRWEGFRAKREAQGLPPRDPPKDG